MQIRPLPRRLESGNPFAQQLDHLICALGTRHFEGALFKIAHEATGCVHLTAFAVREDGEADGLVLASNEGPSSVARSAGEAYVTRFWRLDPINQFYSHAAVTSTGLMTRVDSHDIRSLAYRRNCYLKTNWSHTGAQIIDRVSIFKAVEGYTFKISFHRARCAGSFGSTDIENIVGATHVLAALLARHVGLMACVKRQNGRHTYLNALRAAAPQLSEQEANVCSGIIFGMSSEGIALDLGISINTVRTYRKRAYARLKISSQNELMKLILS